MLGENGSNVISLKSALKGFSPIYGGIANGVCKAKELSTMVFLFELQRNACLEIIVCCLVWGEECFIL